MCGLVAVVSDKCNIDNTRLIESTKKLIHRGPDSEGYFIGTNVAIGHRRLIVVDSDNGQQPMKFNDYVIAYNGEIYNTEEIRKKLIDLGYSFTGYSDTEVLIKGYAEWKEKVLDELNGIYSFAVWNTSTKEMFVGRDRLGVKPLYYAFLNETLVIASEMKAILHYLSIKTVTKKGLQELLALGPSSTQGETIFKNVKSLRPAHYMKYSKGRLKVKRYWNVISKKHTDNLENTILNVRDILIDSINRQLVSDVPLCTFLSGGIDSSAITAIASKKQEIHTYSINYENNDEHFQKNNFQVSSDEKYINLLVEDKDISNEKYIVQNSDLADALKRAVELRDTPGMADIDSSLFLFCNKVKNKHTVALSGECADEIFGGYPWFYQDKFKGEFFPWIRNLDFREQLLKSHWRERLKLKDYLKKRYDETINECPTFVLDNQKQKEDREMAYLNMTWFMNTLLERKDRMSMGASLEVRVPFADHRLVEYLWNVPWEYKMRDGQEKSLLRQALKGILPDEILYRKKNPYPKTHNPEYTKIVCKLLFEALKDEKSILHTLFEKDKLLELLSSEGKEIETPFFGQLMSGPQYLAYLYQIHYWAEYYSIEIEE